MIEQETKAKLAFKLMRDMIASGEWQVGDRYSAIEVAKQFNIGRTTINDAIKMLEKKEFVYTLPNVGFVIKAYRAERLSEDLDIRLALEKLAVQYILKKNKEVDFAPLNSILRLIEASNDVGEYEASIAGRENLRRELFKLAHSPYLESLLEDSWDRQRWYSVKIKNYDPSAYRQLVAFDRMLLEAIIADRGRAALVALKKQRSLQEKIMLDILQEMSK